MTPRWWGLAPLVGVAWAAADYTRASDLLWGCNMAALVLGAGLLARSELAIHVGATAGLAALIPWAVWVATVGDEGGHAILTHVAGPALGVVAARRVPRPDGAVLVLIGGLVGLIALGRAAGISANAAQEPLPTLVLLVALASGLVVVASRALDAPLPGLAAALRLTPAQERAFVDHLARKAARGPGAKAALRALVERAR